MYIEMNVRYIKMDLGETGWGGMLLALGINVFSERYLGSPLSTQTGIFRKWELVVWTRNSMPSLGELLHHVFSHLKLLSS
jgi:hypothetical protein